MINIVEEIEAVVVKMRGQSVKPWNTVTNAENPYYDYGKWLTITNKLLMKDADAMQPKYPLIALRVPVDCKVVNNTYSFTLNIAILDFTDMNYTEQERQANVFKPRLYPLYEAFLKQLKGQGFSFGKGNMMRPEHTVIDRYFWGSDSDKGNRFNDPLDAIEIIDLKISKTQNCIIS